MNSDIFKILGILLISSVLCLILRQKNSEYAMLISVATGIITASLILRHLSMAIEAIKNYIEAYGIETEYFKVALKALGIGYVTSFIADTCRDSGQTSLASKAELAGKAAIFVLSLPLLVSVLNIAVGLIE